MLTVIEHSFETLVIKQSKFIAHLMPFSRYDEILKELRAKHPKARHFVTAFRHLNEHDQIVEGSSDDGEPKGTSGRPTLAVLQGQTLINVAIITVRYFGGTKLGTGGLVRAYSDATNLVIESAGVTTYTKQEAAEFICEYSDVGKVEYLMTQSGVTIIEKYFEPLHVRMAISATASELESFYMAAGRLIISA